MVLRVLKVVRLQGLNTFLRGGLRSGKDLRKEGLYLNGKTLKLSPGSVTVTFASTPAGTQVAIPLPSVLAQIKAQAAAFSALTDTDGHLVLEEVTPSAGVTVDHTGTANAILGLDTAADMVGKVYNAPGAGAPEFVGLEAAPTCEDAFMVIVNE